MKVLCPRCGGTVHGKRGRAADEVLTDHVRLGCPAPEPRPDNPVDQRRPSRARGGKP